MYKTLHVPFIKWARRQNSKVRLGGDHGAKPWGRPATDRNLDILRNDSRIETFPKTLFMAHKIYVIKYGGRGIIPSSDRQLRGHLDCVGSGI